VPGQSEAKPETTDSITVASPINYFSAFSAQKSHVKSKNHLNTTNKTGSSGNNLLDSANKSRANCPKSGRFGWVILALLLLVYVGFGVHCGGRFKSGFSSTTHENTFHILGYNFSDNTSERHIASNKNPQVIHQKADLISRQIQHKTANQMPKTRFTDLRMAKVLVNSNHDRSLALSSKSFAS
jgi:hypothetical protein